MSDVWERPGQHLLRGASQIRPRGSTRLLLSALTLQESGVASCEEAAKKASFMSVLSKLHEKAVEHNDPAITKLADRIGNMTKWC